MLNVNNLTDEMSELLLDAARWMNFKNMLSEKSQIKKTLFLEISTNINAEKIKLIGMFLQVTFSQGFPMNAS